MFEMELITGNSTLRQLSKERWRSHLAAIMDQAEIEAPHNTGLSSALLDVGDNTEGIIIQNIITNLTFLLINSYR